MGPYDKRKGKTMEKIFKLKENGTTVRTEILAGLTTFMTMAYIIALNHAFDNGTGKVREYYRDCSGNCG